VNVVDDAVDPAGVCASSPPTRRSTRSWSFWVDSAVALLRGGVDRIVLDAAAPVTATW